MRAAIGVGAGVDPRHFYRPHPAAIERTLPRRIPAEGDNDAGLRVFVDALEVGDDLELRPEDIRKQRCFWTSGGTPGSATRGCGQAGIALATESVADQKCVVSRLYCN